MQAGWRVYPKTVVCENLIVRLYSGFSAKKGVDFARTVVNSQWKDEGVVYWTSKISNLVARNKPGEAICMFKQMLLDRVRPNYVTFLSLLQASVLLCCKDVAHQIHGWIIKLSVDLEIRVLTVLISIYSLWDLEVAAAIFVQITNKDLVVWTSMISGFIKNEEHLEALKLFREMQDCGVRPNEVSLLSILISCANLSALVLGKEVHGFCMKRPFYTYVNLQNCLLDMYGKCRSFEDVIKVFDRIVRKDSVTWKTMLRACVENSCPSKGLEIISQIELDVASFHHATLICTLAGDLRYGKVLHGHAMKKGFLVSTSITTAIMQIYGKLGEVAMALEVFSSLHCKDVTAWTALISIQSQGVEPHEALNTFNQMRLANAKPNEVTFAALLQACCSMEAREYGEILHGCVTKAGYLFDSIVSSALVDLHCKFGRVNQGRLIFDGVSWKDLICWSSMINGYGLNGYGVDAYETFLDMVRSGIKPNEVVFLSILSACSHCGLDFEGWSCFNLMREVYDISPKLPHYACIVDLLSRGGDVKRALEFVEGMPMEPDERIWGAILSGCRSGRASAGDVEFVVNRIIELDPGKTACYVILSNIFAEQGRWKDVRKMRDLLDDKGSNKTRGCSITV